MLKPFKIIKNVETSAEEVKEVEVNVDTTFVNKGISKLFDKDNNHIGYNISVQEWWWNEEYIEKISQENQKLKQTDLMNKMAFMQFDAKLIKLENKLDEMGQ